MSNHFATALTEALEVPKIEDIKEVGFNKEKFKNLNGVLIGSDSAKMQELAALAHSGVPIVKPVEKIEDSEETKMLKQSSEVIGEALKNPTREAHSKAIAALEDLTKQSIISEATQKQFGRALRMNTDPNHYGTKKKRPNRLASLSKIHGKSNDVIYIEHKGETKLMTLKMAKKKGLI